MFSSAFAENKEMVLPGPYTWRLECTQNGTRNSVFTTLSVPQRSRGRHRRKYLILSCNEAKHNIFSTLTGLERLKTFNVVASSWMTEHRDKVFYPKYEVLSL